jgi:nicotinamidase-related amidase
MLLRAQGVRTVTLCGIASSGVVLSTVLDACDRDYAVEVLEDGCADTDPELHRTLFDKVFSRRGTVATSADWIRGLTSRVGP